MTGAYLSSAIDRREVNFPVVEEKRARLALRGMPTGPLRKGGNGGFHSQLPVVGFVNAIRRRAVRAVRHVWVAQPGFAMRGGEKCVWREQRATRSKVVNARGVPKVSSAQLRHEYKANYLERCRKRVASLERMGVLVL